MNNARKIGKGIMYGVSAFPAAMALAGLKGAIMYSPDSVVGWVLALVMSILMGVVLAWSIHRV